ncbi:MAG: transcriptional regulator NrdR [Eubacteriales bacterium]
MKCPYCTYHDSKVIDSRPAEAGAQIRRRRECLECGKRFTTYEEVETYPLVIKKKDGGSQSFERSKLLKGLLRACEKRSVDLQILENLITEIETSLRNNMEKEIPSSVVGELAMERLKQVDEVAYIRFASVYQHFENINDFRDVLNDLNENNERGG